MKKNKKLFYTLIILFLFFILSVIFSLITMNSNTIISDISINDINISEMSKDDASALLSKYTEKKSNTELKLTYTKDNDTYEKNLDLSILNINYNLPDSLNSAYSMGRSGNIFKNNFIILKTLFFKKNYSLDISLDENMLNNIIMDISSNLPGKLIQSSYYIEDDNLVITKGTAGLTVDVDALKNNLKNILQSLQSDNTEMQIPVKQSNPDDIDLEKIRSEVYKDAKDAYFEEQPFKVHSEVKGVDFDVEKAKEQIENNPDKTEYIIKLKFTEPKIKTKDLKIDVFKDKLATFSTKYNESNTDRTTNLNIAASKIDGTILAPGEEFSYNKIVGERSIAAGYKEAKVYQNGQIVDGLGGGICQISSTLYNAAIFANLKITQRFNHQFITSYVPAGRDATVAYGSKDFKFVNNRAYPIRVDVSVTSGIATVDIYGIKEENEYQVDFDVETVSNIPYETHYQTDNSLPSGTERVKQCGANGIIVNTYKLVKQNGIVISKELISKDTYKALDKVVLQSPN